MTPSTFAALLWKALKAWFGGNATRYGAALAYYTLFAMAPVLLVVIGIAGLLFGEEAVRGEIVGQIGGLIGREGAEAVQNVLRLASAPRDGIAATITGAATFLLATTGAFLELQAALNMIWRVRPNAPRGFSFKALFVRRLRSLGLVVSIGFLLMVSLGVSAVVSAVSIWMSERAPGWPTVIVILNHVFSLTLATVLFALLFRVLPDVKLGWRDVGVGALVTAVLFTIGQRLIGLYLGNSSVASPFGAAGAVVILLVWVYYSTQIVLLGAEFTHVYATHNRPPPELMAHTTHAPESTA